MAYEGVASEAFPNEMLELGPVIGQTRQREQPLADHSFREVPTHHIWAADDARVGCGEDADGHLPVLVAGELAPLDGQAHPLAW
jgi:hypothetical protein